MENIQSNIQSAQPSQKPVRLHYIDWVRLLATLGVFLYHATRPFGNLEGFIKNDEISLVVTVIFLLLLGPFGIPLFFMMAGASSRFALMRRTGRQFAIERVKRIAIPFVVGSILLTPLQIYMVWLYNGSYEGSFLAFLPTFIENLPGGMVPISEGGSWGGLVPLSNGNSGTVFISLEPTNFVTDTTNFPLIPFMSDVPSSKSVIDSSVVIINMLNRTQTNDAFIGFPRIRVDIKTF
ncbi:MAG: acyltransferase [candidate division Zixibacteria bacterium]|nr:acyltransferase [candidate division Zixibacteria bacterium]